MALSFSRPDVTSPASVAEATFSTVRRGADPSQVRELLRAVATELGRLQERERALERELRATREASSTAPQLDDETVSRMLGEETLRVLQTARESASQIKIKAEEGAARILREATDEANRLREEAGVEAARRRNDAAADAEAEVSLAKQQGREMVNEARAYRERVLSELTRRRETARQQIEQLVQGRDRLLQAFERARLVAVDVVSELAPLGEPDEYVNLAPTTGPVPIMVPTRTLADEPPADVPDRSSEQPIEAAQVQDSHVDENGAGEAPVSEAAFAEPVPAVEEPVTEELPTVEAQPAAAEPAAAEPAAPEPSDPDAAAADAAAAAGAEEESPSAPDGGTSATGDQTNVVELFARLRAGTATAESESGPADGDADSEGEGDSVFARRDAALVPLIVAAARKVKRVLADEQNGVLDALRRREPVRDLADVLPSLDEHAARYHDAITGDLSAAAAAGAESIVAGAPAADLGAVRTALRDDLVSPLRDRLERCVVDGDGDNEEITRRVRAVYREWKTQHIDEHLDDVFRLAYGVGAYRAIEPGTPVCWLVDPDGPACPDAEDNALAGEVAAGEPFPTGNVSAPAHAGCRCVLAPTRQ